MTPFRRFFAAATAATLLAFAAPAAANDNTKGGSRAGGLDAVFERADATLAGGDADAAFAILAEGVERWPGQAMPSLSYEFVVAHLQDLPVEAPGRHRLLSALHAAGYQREFGADSSELWYQLALGHLHRGEADEARQVLERVVDPWTWLAVRVDRRFDAVVSDGDPRNDLARSVSRRVADLRSRAYVEPRAGSLLLEQLSAMMMAGMHEDVARIAGEVGERAAGGAKVFDDQDESLSWIYDTGARALLRLGRDEEALAIYRKAAGTSEAGAENVSQRINLAVLLAALERADEAAEVAATVPEDNISPFGRMVLASVQWDIARLRRDEAGQRRAGAYLRKHREDGKGVHFTWLLEAGEQDEAAAAFIDRLVDPASRREALLDAQRLRRPRSTPGGERHLARLDAMLARPDVQAAIERVGRVQTVDIYPCW